MKFPLSVLALILVCMRAAGDTTVAVGDMSGFETTMGSGVTTYSLTSDVTYTYSFSEETPSRLPAPVSSGMSWIITSADTEDTKSLTLSGADYLASVNKGGSNTKFIITNLENFSVSGYNGGYSAFSSTWGGIFYSDSQRQEVHLKGNSGAITFSGNKVEKVMTGEKPQYTHIRSAVLNIDGFNSKLLIEDNGGVVTFENNIINFSSGASGYTGKSTSQVFGAAINLRSGTMSLSSNTGGVVFKGNRVENATGTVEGGAVILAGDGTIAMNDNAGGVSFQGNSARSTWSYMAADSTTTNTTSYYVGGGAVSAYNTNSFIEISGNSPMQGSAAAVSFSGNVLEAAGTNTSVRGGAIIASNLSISGNHGGVEFLNNHAISLFEGVTEAPIHVCGGAIYMGFSNTASICNNEGPITIQGNWAAASSTTDVVVRGGFFSGTSASIVNMASLEISGNQGDIDISGNYVRAMRAATAEVSMTDSAALGGAIFASNLTLKNNTGNVTFRKNYEVTTNRTILRSVVASTLDISADAGKSIMFYDSVYSSGVASFNAFGNGSVIFTGETTQADLREVKGGTTIWDAEIAASRTSVFKGLVDVQGGKLEVRSGAVLQGVGMSVAGDAAVSLQEGSITHTGEAAFESGSMLEVVGVGNVLTASTLEFAGESTLKFVYGEGLAENAALTFTGTLSLAESAVIQLSGFAGHTSTAQQLISMQNSTLQGWNTGTLTFVDETGAALDASHFVWENDVLYYKTGQTILTWSNGTGDGKWNNISANWTTGDTSISSTEHADIIFGSNENTRETITLEGELTVRNMTVQQGGNYAYTASTAGTSLSLESLTVETGATADIQLGSGALNANEISGAGTVTISGGTLNMNSLAVSAGTTTLDGPLGVAADSTLVVTGGGILKATDSASIDVQGTLDLSQFTYKITDGNSNKGIITVFNAITGSGTVLLKSGAEIQTEDDKTAVNLAANYKVAGDAANASLSLTSWAKQNKTWRTWTVGTGGSLTIGDAGDGTLSMLTGQQLQVVDGGELKVGTLNLGYDDINGYANNPGSLLMSGDASKVTLNHIHIQNGTENWLNDITITGGTLKVTGAEAVTYATGTNIARTNITLGGTEGQTVTLQTGDNDWTLTRQSDAASTLTVGDVTIDAANTGTITLAGATLNGTITNNAKLALGSGVTVAEGTQAVISGSGLLKAATGASIDVQGTLDLSGCTYSTDGIDSTTRNRQMVLLFNAISGPGTVLLKSGAEIQTQGVSKGVNLAANYKVAGTAANASLALASWADKANKIWRTWTVGAGGSLTIGDAGDGTLSMLAGQQLQVVNGGELKVGTLNLGYNDINGNANNPGSLLMSGDASKVTLNHIHIQNGTAKQLVESSWLNDITITGGTLKVTGAEAVTYATGTNIARTNITIGGTEGQTVTLQTGDNNWTLTRQSDAASTLTVGDVTIDAANTGTITLAGATLTGTITNNAKLALGGSTTVAEGTQAVISGSGLLKAATGASIDVQGTLDLSGCTYSTDGIDDTTRNKQMALLFNAISGSGTVLLKSGAEIQTEGDKTAVNLAANYKVTGDAANASLSLTSWAKQNKTWRTWTVGTGGSLTIGDAGDGTLSMLTGQQLQVVDGGELKVGTLNLGYNDINRNANNPGSLLMSGDASKVTLNHIHIQNGTAEQLVESSWMNDITITGGTLKVTGAEAVTYAIGTNIARTNITIGGTEGQTVTLQTGDNDWTLTRQSDAASTLTVGDVTIDAANTGTITLAGATLNGTITNNARLALGSGVTVAEGTQASIYGSKVQLDATLTSAGTLNLYTDAIYLGTTLKDVITTGGTVFYSLGGENGFQSINGVNYYLSTNGNVIVQKATTATLRGDVYELQKDTSGGQYNGGLYIAVEDTVTASDFYISSGKVTVDSAVHEAASRYYLRGGTMLIDKNLSVNNSLIDYTEGDAATIQLSDGASLVLDSEANGLNVINLLSGKLSALPATDDATPTGRLIISSDATLANGFASTFTGAVELQDTKLTVGAGPSEKVNVSSISDFILNGTSEIYYHADPTQDVDIRKITVQSGTGSLKLQDSSNSPMMVNEVAVERGAVFKFWSQWHDSALTIETLSGGGKFLAESADAISDSQNPLTTINSLTGFTGDLEFVKDTDKNMTVVVQTGTGEALSFNSLTATNLNGAINFTFNVQRNTTVQTLTAAAGTVSLSTGTTLTLGDGVNASTHSIGTLNAAGNSTIHLNADATLHAFSKSGNGTLTLTGSGIYDLGTLEIGQASATITDKVTMGTGTSDDAQWKGTVKISGGEYNTSWRDNTSQSIQNINFNNLGQAGSTVEIAEGNLYGYIHNVDADYAADIRLTGSFYIQNSYTRESSYSAFSGSIIADEDGGHIYITRTNDRQNQYEFKGDVSGWKTSLTQNTTNNGVTNEIIFSADAHTINAAIINENAGVLNLQIATAEDATLSKNVDVTKLEVSNTARLVGESNSITAGNVEISQKGATLSNVTVEGSSICAADTTGDAKGSISNSLVRLQEETAFTIENMVLTNTTLAADSSATAVKLKNVEGSTARLTMGAFTLDATPQVDAQAGGETHGSLSYTNGLAVSGNSDATLTLNLDVLGAVEKSGTYDLTITLSGYGSDFVLPENISSLVSFDTTSWLYEALVSQNANFSGATAAVRTLAAVETAGVPTVQYTAGTGDNVGSLVITISGLNVPEPTTSTLGLLALAALAARRRRK